MHVWSATNCSETLQTTGYKSGSFLRSCEWTSRSRSLVSAISSATTLKCHSGCKIYAKGVVSKGVFWRATFPPVNIVVVCCSFWRRCSSLHNKKITLTLNCLLPKLRHVQPNGIPMLHCIQNLRFSSLIYCAKHKKENFLFEPHSKILGDRRNHGLPQTLDEAPQKPSSQTVRYRRATYTLEENRSHWTCHFFIVTQMRKWKKKMS
jgi:hypothetical protein